MTTPQRRATARWPDGWRPQKQAHGRWHIDDHTIELADRRWHAWCMRDPAHRKHVPDSGSTSKQHAIDTLATHMRTCQPWKIYEQFIVNTGGNDVADVAEVRTSPKINLPVFTIETAVSSQIALLRRLADAGLLRRPDDTRKA